MNPAAIDYEVIIVGAGPTGLTLANILGLYGIATLLIERNPATVSEPRAVSIDDESLRTMQFIGLIDQVKSRIVEGYGSYYYSPRGDCFAKVVPETAEFGHARRSAFRQPVLEAQLRAGLERFPCVEARFSVNATSVVDTGDAALVTIAPADGASSDLRARYVVACDGARSGVREALGIAMGGSTYDARWLIVDLAGSIDRFRHTRVYCDPARPALALPGPEGARRYEFMLLPGETPEQMVEEARVRALLADHSAADARLEIVRKAVYHFHARIAERWRAGPIFLAGDAAHLSPPFAGQGMNSGVRDAQNLGWKLAQVLRGELGAAALASYEVERKPHARALIEMAIMMGRVMMPGSPLAAAATRAALRTLSLYPPARDYIMQMKYKPKPYYEHGLLAGAAGPGLRGRMFPQPVVERAGGTRCPLDTLLGKGYAVLEWDDGNEAPAPPSSDRAVAARVIRVIPREHRFVPGAGGSAEQIRDLTGSIGTLLSLAGARGVILRPDRYVAACLARGSAGGEADRLFAELARLSQGEGPGSIPAATPQ
jgi:3-(3-hydroxy-phenyl)propionate hydroxylase